MHKKLTVNRPFNKFTYLKITNSQYCIHNSKQLDALWIMSQMGLFKCWWEAHVVIRVADSNRDDQGCYRFQKRLKWLPHLYGSLTRTFRWTGMKFRLHQRPGISWPNDRLTLSTEIKTRGINFLAQVLLRFGKLFINHVEGNRYGYVSFSG